MPATTAVTPTPNGKGGRMESAPQSSIVSATGFECTVLPPANTLSGALLPKLLQKGRQRRIVSVEVHRITSHLPKNGTSSYDECIIRVLAPKKRLKKGEEVDDDDGSVETNTAEFLDPHKDASGSEAEDTMYPGWRAKYRFPVRCVNLKGTRRNSVHMDIQFGKRKESREIIFAIKEDAARFYALMQSEMALDADRTDRKMQVALGAMANQILAQPATTFLVEIVSAWDLPAADLFSSDPFVSCILDSVEVHRTEFISKTLDPIWTIATGSLFLLSDVQLPQLFRGEGLLCIVYDFDKFGANDPLGAVTIPPKTIYDAQGERMELELGPPPGKLKQEDGSYGTLAVRIRRATQYDIEFMENVKKRDKGTIQVPGMKQAIELDDHSTFHGGKGNIHSMLSRRYRTCKSGPNMGKREYKIRPGPDPKRIEETTWMTAEEIETEYLNDSLRWVDAGAGRLGRLFVEILGCDDVPNLDVGGFAGNKTDAFVSLVFEDAVVQTDVVDDTLSPRWMPWTKRAFIFHMMHSSSQLFMGVFDYDAGINPADDHDLIGRISVDLSNLRKDTVYVLNYKLCTTARMSGRKEKGSITIRLRMEIEDERMLLLSALEPPPKMYVNVKTRKEFRVVRYTCTGKYNMEKYSMKVINSYIEELLALQHILFFLQDACIALLLWRGTLPVHIPYVDKTILFPIHSLSALLIAVLMVERPHLIPSIFFASIAWFLLATQAYRRSLPDIWSRCKSTQEFVEILLSGESQNPPDNIRRRENFEAAQAFVERWRKRIADAELAATKAVEEQMQAQEEYERQMEEVGDTTDVDIASQSRGGVSIDPFKSLLFPVQQNLALVCRYLRHVRHIITWQECYIAFWITIGSMLLAFICVFVPWFFLFKWTARLTVWTLFGPWMKLVDIYYVSKIKPLTEEELKQKKQRDRERRLMQTKTAVAEARKKREEQLKLKDMKRHLFGKYITRVPVLKEDRYRDLPTPESFAVPYVTGSIALSELAMQDAGYRKERLTGQHLVGNMIPKIEQVGFTEAPIGQPTSRVVMIDRSRPGGNFGLTADSTIAAYMKLGSLVLTAAIVTWFGVPLLAAVTLRILSLFR